MPRSDLARAESGAGLDRDKAGVCRHPAEQCRRLFSARDYISGDVFSVVRCERCGLALTMPAPSPHRMDRHYPAAYYGVESRYSTLLARCLSLLYRARARRIERRAGTRAGVVLDVGCGRGELLGELRRRGWRTIGTERNAAAAAYARDALGLDVRAAAPRELGLPPGSVDVVVLWHVLEHVPDPAGLLAEVSGLLRPGGLALIAVPDFGSPEARLGGPSWFHLDVPRHLNHFDGLALRRLLTAAGLEPIATDRAALEYDLFSFVQTVLNRLGVRHNLLYNLIRSRGARVLGGAAGDWSRTDLLLTVVLAPLIGTAGLPWLMVAPVMGLSATQATYARRAGPRDSDKESGHPDADSNNGSG
ncbi:MAG TPA: class I SAM-dependent methyltransferase [Chloroflexota bacterium]|nr:class I SAM-dependent methyltransferase [Chloroflexota bacterium]